MEGLSQQNYTVPQKNIPHAYGQGLKFRQKPFSSYFKESVYTYDYIYSGFKCTSKCICSQSLGIFSQTLNHQGLWGGGYARHSNNWLVYEFLYVTGVTKQNKDYLRV